MIVKCTALCYYCLRKTRKPKQPEHICRTENSSASANWLYKNKSNAFKNPGKLLFSGVSLSKKVIEKWPFSRIGDENAV